MIFLCAGVIAPLLGYIRRGLAYLVALVASALVLIMAIKGLFMALDAGTITYRLGGWVPPVGIELVLDPLSAFFSVLVSGIGLIVLIYSRKSVEHELPDKVLPFYSLALLLLAGLSGLVITGDLFNLYVFLEISALASYALVAMGDEKAPVGAFRYLTLGTAAAAFYLIGLALIFIQTGTLNMMDVANILHETHDSSRPVLLGIILLSLGVGLKMAVFPMHAWLADAYTYASSSATALIAPIGTKVSAYVLIRFMFFVIGPEMISEKMPMATLIGYLGMIGMIWGSLLAVCQKELKRMLAYSSVAQVGYIALGIGLANPFGFIGAVLHALNHACMKACLFFVSGNMRYKLGHSYIPDFKENMRLSMPWSTGAFALAAVSMVGLPPTAGFFSKWYLALGSIEQSNWVFVAALILSSLLNAVYFFRVLEKMYMKPSEAEKALSASEVARADAPGSMLLPMFILAAGILVLGIFNAYIVTTFIMPMIPSGL